MNAPIRVAENNLKGNMIGSTRRKDASRRRLPRKASLRNRKRTRIFERLEGRCLLNAQPIIPATSEPESNPVAAAAPNGDYVVVWEHGSFPNRDLHARRFSANGIPKDSGDLIITATNRDEFEPDVAMDANGNFVVTYTQVDSDGDLDVSFRVFDADGQEQVSESKVNTYDSGYPQRSSSVAMEPDGRFVVAWSSESGLITSSNGNDLQYRRFDANGMPRDPDEHHLADGAHGVDVAVNDAGLAAFAYTVRSDVIDGSENGSDDEVHFQLIADSGSTIQSGPVNAPDPSRDQDSPSISMSPSGKFVVAWEHTYSAGDDDIFVQRFSAEGRKLGSEQVVANSYDDESYPSVTMTDDTFIVAFGSTEEASASGDRVYLHIYDYDTGWLTYEPFEVGNQDLVLNGVDIAMPPNGRAVFAVTQQVDEQSVLAQIVRLAPASSDTVGLYQPDISQFHLKDSFTPGASDHYFSFGPGGANWVPLSGDWDGDGTDTIGLYQPDISLFHLKDRFTPGASDQYFAFGPGNAGWIPLAGDWNGDGIDTIGLYQPELSLFHLKDSFTPGASDHYFSFGPAGAGWTPLVGDWNGDGVDTVGLYQPDVSLFHLKDSFTPGASDQYFAFGPGSAGWVPLSGDWNEDSIDTIGLYQPDNSLFHLKDSFTPGASDQYFAFGPGNSGWLPLTGDWNGGPAPTSSQGLAKPDAAAEPDASAKPSAQQDDLGPDRLFQAMVSTRPHALRSEAAVKNDDDLPTVLSGKLSQTNASVINDAGASDEFGNRMLRRLTREMTTDRALSDVDLLAPMLETLRAEHVTLL